MSDIDDVRELLANRLISAIDDEVWKSFLGLDLISNDIPGPVPFTMDEIASFPRRIVRHYLIEFGLFFPQIPSQFYVMNI